MFINACVRPERRGPFYRVKQGLAVRMELAFIGVRIMFERLGPFHEAEKGLAVRTALALLYICVFLSSAEALFIGSNRASPCAPKLHAFVV